jgi:BirA family biotin operon repressor/biotin-[acetyl-CoA-carboxylase] ligase
MKNYKNFIIHNFDELESTNSYAFEKAKNRQMFEKEIVVATLQSAGRGRLDRKWISPQGNLYFSLILQPFQKGVRPLVSQISFVAAVALRLALEKGVRPLASQSILVQNKWPNDVLINGKKVAGILLESDLQSGFVVLGVGVNVASNPENVMFLATNLSECGVKISPENLLEKFLDEFDVLYQNWLSFGFDGVRRLWLEKAYNLGSEINVKNGEKIVKGVFEEIDLEGNLCLKIGDKIEKISTADVS